MRFEKFESADLTILPEFQPPSWGDLGPRFIYFLDSSFCEPLKMTVDGKTVGIGTTVYHRDTAWLACIVVHPGQRNQGLGRLITQELIDQVSKRGIKTIFLDATQLGFPVYSKLGFETDGEYAHLRTEKPLQDSTISKSIISFRPEYRDALLKIDQQVSGEDRACTLDESMATAHLFVDQGELKGFFFPDLRDGLIVAITPEAGIELMKLRLQNRPFAILPAENNRAVEFLNGHGFEQYRRSKRMRLGPKRSWQPLHLYNRISGQLG